MCSTDLMRWWSRRISSPEIRKKPMQMLYQIVAKIKAVLMQQESGSNSQD